MKVRTIGKKVQGASHKRVKKECQDFLKKCILDNAAILAVADGHGSNACPYSRLGAIIAVDVFCKLMAEYCSSYSNDIDSLFTYLNREGDTTVARNIEAEWKSRIEIIHKNKGREMPLTNAGEIDKPKIWRQYGATLLGLVITPSFFFAFQTGDGDILYLCENTAENVVQSHKILGVEVHSLSDAEAWKNAVTNVGRIIEKKIPQVFMLATDGFANSYENDHVFLKTCIDYYTAIREMGVEDFEQNLECWLNETSLDGSGDDIATLFAYIDFEPTGSVKVS